jgi:hypothetical protein
MAYLSEEIMDDRRDTVSETFMDRGRTQRLGGSGRIA